MRLLILYPLPRSSARVVHRIGTEAKFKGRRVKAHIDQWPGRNTAALSFDAETDLEIEALGNLWKSLQNQNREVHLELRWVGNETLKPIILKSQPEEK